MTDAEKREKCIRLILELEGVDIEAALELLRELISGCDLRRKVPDQ